MAESGINQHPSPESASATAYVDALFSQALERRASDLHLEPQKTGLQIRLRIDGLLHELPMPPPDIAQRLCARIKIMARLDIVERRLPLLGDLSRLSNLIDLSRTLAAMLTAGISLNEALTHTAASCRNAAFCQAVLNATAKVESGSSLHQAMTGAPYFPEPFRRIIQLGEETGKLSQMFEHAAQGYQEEIRRSVDFLLPLIEPILMLILGMMIGGLILAMYLPIFAMGSLL